MTIGRPIARDPSGTETEAEESSAQARFTLMRAVGTRAWAPLLIVVSVLVVLHDIAFRGLLPAEQLDLLGFWLPTHCLLGRSLANGHVLAWNPYAMGGLPFVSDPQSGWMNLEAMVLYSTLRCDRALRAYLVLQPIVGGLGLYWFLREEGLARPAAAIGGLSQALVISGSQMALSLPFSASFAWTAVALATAARYARTVDWPGRLLWLLALAVAWGQILASHASHGFILGSGALVAYLLARLLVDRRAGRRRPGEVLLLLLLPFVAFPLVNLAFLVPRLAYLPRTTLGGGYEELRSVAREVVPGTLGPPAAQRASEPEWLLKLASAPGAYLGAAALALSFAGAWSTRHRPLVWAFGSYGLLFYVLSQQAVAGAVDRIGEWVPFSDILFHVPLRMGFAVLLALPVLCAVGVETWRRPGTLLRRAALVAPGVGLFGVVPLMLGDPSRMALFWIGLAVGGSILVLSLRRAVLIVLLPVAAAVELVANGLWGQAVGENVRVDWIEPRLQRPLTNFREPYLPVAGYLEPGPIARALRASNDSRYFSTTGKPPRNQAFLPLVQAAYWPLEENNRSWLFEIQSVHGYNPVQLRRFWLFVRAVEPTKIKYNVAAFGDPSPAVLNLLDIDWVVGPSLLPPTDDLAPIVREGTWTLYRRAEASPRASLVDAWMVAASEQDALRRVSSPGFDPSTLVVLEEHPGLPEAVISSDTGSVAYEDLGPQAARIVVESSEDALLLIRTIHDPNWHATVDGNPVPVLRADYLFQAVPMSEGRHVVELRYDDPWIGYGLAGSGLAMAALAVAAALVRLRRRTSRRAGHRAEEIQRSQV
jgi:hypothetical protein